MQFSPSLCIPVSSEPLLSDKSQETNLKSCDLISGRVQVPFTPTPTIR